MLCRLCGLRHARRRGVKVAAIALGIFVALMISIQSRVNIGVLYEDTTLNEVKSREFRSPDSNKMSIKNHQEAKKMWRESKFNDDKVFSSIPRAVTQSNSKSHEAVKPVLLENNRPARERPSVQVHSAVVLKENRSNQIDKLAINEHSDEARHKLFSLSNSTLLKVPNRNYQISNRNSQNLVPNKDRLEDRVEDKGQSLYNRRILNSNQHLPSFPHRSKRLVQPKSSKESGPTIKIMPKHPSVPEGRPLMVTCGDVSVVTRKKSIEDALFMSFEFPETLSEKLKNTIQVLVRPGLISIRFAHIRKGHAGIYTCVVRDKDGNKFVYDIPVEVLDRVGDANLGEGEAMAIGQLRRDWRLSAARNSLSMKSHLSQEQLDRLQAAREAKWASIGMMDAYEYDYDKVDEIVEELREKVGRPVQVNLTLLAERGKKQQKQIDHFCDSRGFGDLAYTLPGEGQGHVSFYRHMLISDKAKTLFCFVPKVGCTNLKVLFFVVQGFMPLSQLLEARDNVNQERIEGVQLQESFLNRNDFIREFTLRHYFKFMMVRNPLHRLVSGYRSKVQRFPLTGLNDSRPHYNFLRKAIYLQLHPKEYSEFLRKRGRMEINITFSDFITYWLLQSEDIKFDEHFRSMMTLCQPCRSRFSFYAKFKNFEEDTQVLVNKINSRPEFIRAGYHSGSDSTESISPSYYAQLSQSAKLAVLELLELDLDFYYHLFPEETGTHNTILGLKEPVSIPLNKHNIHDFV